MKTRDLESTLSSIGRWLDNFQRKRVVQYDIDKKSSILLASLKEHTLMLLKDLIQTANKSGVSRVLYQNAQAWRLTHGLMIDMDKENYSKANAQGKRDIGVLKMTANFMNENIIGRPDNWFDTPGFERKYEAFAKEVFGKSAGRSFSRHGIYINTKMEVPEIADAIRSRQNFIKGFADEDFARFQDILYDKYYLEGLHPDALAKELQAMNLWDEYYVGRSQTIARTETASFVSAARRGEYKKYEFDGHYWLIAFDNLVRDSHLENNQEGVIPIDQKFSSDQLYPGDGNDPAEIINCRCSEEAVMLEDVDVIEKGVKSTREQVLKYYYDQGYESISIPDISKKLSSYLKSKGVTAAIVDQETKKVYFNYKSKFLK